MSLAIGRVIGDVIDQFTPSVTMDITYNSHYTVVNGHELKPNIITSKPHVQIGGVDMRSSYTIVILFLCTLKNIYVYACINNVFIFYMKILTDPDAPSPSDPYLREHLHW